jgi:3-oxoacyl-[acyl-carrier protein] reductase
MVSIDLTGQSAVVTGASQGLGREIATLLHRAGAGVVVNYWPDPADANRRQADSLVAALGDRAVAHPADVRDADAMAALMEAAVARFGRLDILVNNAGIIRDRSLRNMTAPEWQDVIDTNLSGVFNACRAAGRPGPPGLADGGRIVSLSSVSAFLGFFGQANYAAAKAGVVALTKVLARELARRRITVNAVAPGVALTEMGRSIPEEARAAMLANVPLGRFAEPEEIAGAVLFLVSPLASYVTGQTLHVNGGWWG